MQWLTCPIFLKNIDLEYATVHPGETVKARVEWYGELPPEWSIKGYQSVLTKTDLLSGVAIEWQECPVYFDQGAVSLVIDYHRNAFLLPLKL